MVGTECKCSSLEDIVKEVVGLIMEDVCLVLVEVVTELRKEPLEGMATDNVAVKS